MLIYHNIAATSFSSAIANPGRVTLNVYSITCQKVATVVDNMLDAGVHSMTFDGGGLASGVYV